MIAIMTNREPKTRAYGRLRGVHSRLGREREMKRIILIKEEQARLERARRELEHEIYRDMWALQFHLGRQ